MMTILVGAVSNLNVLAINELKVGDYVIYGHYQHEPIIWQVINIDDQGNPLLFSESAISYKAFDASELKDEGTDELAINTYRSEYGNNLWSVSNLREWLNSDAIIVAYSTAIPSKEGVSNGDNAYDIEKGFLSNFTDDENLGILTTSHKAILPIEDIENKVGGDQAHTFEFGVPTVAVNNYSQAYYMNSEEKIFLLSVEELSSYVVGNGLDLLKYPTEIAVAADESGRGNLSSTVSYWLRTPTATSATAVRTVTADGQVNYDNAYYSYNGVVPAMYLDGGICEIKSGEGGIDNPYEIQVNGIEVEFEDKNLEAAIREELGKASGPIYESEINKIQKLDASSRQINDLNGMDLLTGLVSLDLSYNNINDFSSLYKLEHLNSLELQYNNFEDLDFLVQLIGNPSFSQLLTIDMTGNNVDLTDEAILSAIQLLATMNIQVNFFEDLGINEKISTILSTYKGSLQSEDEANIEKETLAISLETLLEEIGSIKEDSLIEQYDINSMVIQNQSREVITMKKEMAKQLKQNGIELNRELVTHTTIQLSELDVMNEHTIVITKEVVNNLLTDDLVIQTSDYELVFNRDDLVTDFIRNNAIYFIISAEIVDKKSSNTINELNEQEQKVGFGQTAQNMQNIIENTILEKDSSLISLINEVSIQDEIVPTKVFNIRIEKDDLMESNTDGSGDNYFYGSVGFNVLTDIAMVYTTFYKDDTIPINMGGIYDNVNHIYRGEIIVSGQYYLSNNKLAMNDIGSIDETKMIEYLVAKDIMQLKDQDQFKPDESITRGEVAAALIKLTQLYNKNAENYFEDVTTSHPLYNYIVSSADKGIVSGYGDNTFRPDNNIIKAEFTKMLGAILAYKKGYIYPDAWQTYVVFDNTDEIDDWVLPYLSLCIREGIINAGDGIIYEQDQPLTRLEAAKLLYKLSLKL